MVLVPTLLIVVGILLVLAGARLIDRSTVVPAARPLGVLLALRGTLSLLAASGWTLQTAAATMRLWPLVDVGLVALGLLVAYRIHRGDQTVQTGSGNVVPVFLLTTGGLLIFALAVRPGLYWGGAEHAPLAMLAGLRPMGLAAVAATLVGSVSPLARLDTTRRVRLVLATLVALPVLHWACTDLVLVQAAGYQLVDVRPGPAHYGRLLALPVLAVFLARLLGQASIAIQPARRHAARWSLVACLAVAVPTTAVLHMVGLGWMGTVTANTWVAVGLDALWALPVAGWLLLAPSLRRATAEADAPPKKRVTDRLVFPEGPLSQ